MAKDALAPEPERLEDAGGGSWRRSRGCGATGLSALAFNLKRAVSRRLLTVPVNSLESKVPFKPTIEKFDG